MSGLVLELRGHRDPPELLEQRSRGQPKQRCNQQHEQQSQVISHGPLKGDPDPVEERNMGCGGCEFLQSELDGAELVLLAEFAQADAKRLYLALDVEQAVFKVHQLVDLAGPAFEAHQRFAGLFKRSLLGAQVAVLSRPVSLVDLDRGELADVADLFDSVMKFG